MSPVRLATPADAPAIARVHVQAWRETYAGILPASHLAGLDVARQTEQWHGWMRVPTTSVHVAQLDGEIVGFASAGPAHDDAPAGYDAELYSIYLRRDAQGRGLGAALFAAARETTGGRALVVWVLAKNPARAFYERLGGRLVGEKTTELAGEMLVEVAYGWPALAGRAQS